MKSPIAKFLCEAEIAAVTTGIGATLATSCWWLRTSRRSLPRPSPRYATSSAVASELADPNVLAYCWVYEFPLLEWKEEENRWDATHNPFSGFLEEDAHLLESDPGAVRAKQYDLVGNGNELGGGSVRNHRRADQQKMFELMGYNAEDTAAPFRSTARCPGVRCPTARRHRHGH